MLHRAATCAYPAGDRCQPRHDEAGGSASRDSALRIADAGIAADTATEAAKRAADAWFARVQFIPSANYLGVESGVRLSTTAQT
jgi:hypothetical protein